MMKIESIAAQPDRVGRHLVKFSDGSAMRLYRQTVEDFCLYTGMELDDKQMIELRQAAQMMSARMRAVRILSVTSVSKDDLEQRLIRKGENPVCAKQAVNWMSDLNLLDDSKTAEQIVQKCIHKGYGVSRAKQALYEKRIPKDLWQDALKDYPDQTEKIISFLQARVPDFADERQVRRAMDALIRRGHSYSEIRSAMEQISLDIDEFPEG